LQNIEDFLNGAEHGVIYFNMGSMIRAETLPDEKRDAFLQAFSEMPQRVLWKWEADTLPGQPKNVKIAKWLPQFDILSMQTRLMSSHLAQCTVQKLQNLARNSH
jgi:Glycosyl transferases, related to UDP-glucuronosyltransferase